MNIRVIHPNDINELKRLHELYFKDEFEFPNFLQHFLSCFVVTDNSGNIISGGGVRTIAEPVIITDKGYEIKTRRKALKEMLTASAFTASSREYNQLHAFVQDEMWERHLKRVGFKATKGKSLVLNL